MNVSGSSASPIGRPAAAPATPRTTSSYTDSSTRSRLPATHTSPIFTNAAIIAQPTAASRSASANTITGDFPPSSRCTGVRLPRRDLHHPPTRLDAPGEAHEIDARVADQLFPDRLARAKHDVEDTGRQTRVVEHACELAHGHDRLLGRLRDDRATGRERGRDPLAPRHQRTVPRQQLGHDTRRIAQPHRQHLGPAARHQLRRERRPPHVAVQITRAPRRHRRTPSPLRSNRRRALHRRPCPCREPRGQRTAHDRCATAGRPPREPPHARRGTCGARCRDRRCRRAAATAASHSAPVASAHSPTVSPVEGSTIGCRRPSPRPPPPIH